MSFQSTSEVFGGAQAYNPGSTYFPLTDYMSKSGFTHAANVHTCFGIIQADPFVTATQTYRSVFRSVHSGNTIGSLNLQPTDAATAPAGGQMFGRDSVGGVMFDIRCSDVLVDGNKHWFFFAYNAATADYIFIVDGKDATIVAETANTGTQSSGASAAIGLGSNDAGTATVDYQGEISFFGYDDSYRENWYDFFESDGTPKEIDTAGWAEWGAQPLIFSPHADMRNNLGSLTAFNINGTGMRAGDMMNNAIPYRGLATIGDATTADILTGKVAWANAQRVSGTAIDVVPSDGYPKEGGAQVSRRMVDFEIPNGVGTLPAGTFTPTRDMFHTLHPDATLSFPAGDPTWGSGGVMWATTGVWDVLMQVNNLPAYTTNAGRIYHAEGKITGDLVNEDGIRLVFNYVDGNNFWEARLYWYSSSVMRIYLLERTGGVNNFRGTAVNLSGYSSIHYQDNPNWEMRVIDRGDCINFLASVWGHNDDATDAVCVREEVSYYAASRNHQTATTFQIAQGGGTIDRFRVANVQVRDRIF